MYRLLRFFTKIRAHLRRCSSFAQKVTLGSPVRLQAPSRRLAAATNLLRVRGFNPSTENTSELSPLCASSPTTTRCAGLAVGFLVTTLGIFFVNASLVGASFVSLAPIFLQKSERTYAAAPPLRKRSRSARLLGCKRPRDGSLPQPTFCGFEGSNPSDKNENISFCRLLTRRSGLRIVRDDVFFFKANAVSHSLRRSSTPRKASGFVGTPNTGYASLAATFL